MGWQIIPAGRRLFIRAMEENAHTNMTIVTNMRAYQFDLRSSSADAVFGSEELTYVVRFFYPGDPNNPAPVAAGSIPSVAPLAAQSLPLPPPSPIFTPAPVVPQDQGYSQMPPRSNAPDAGYNNAPYTPAPRAPVAAAPANNNNYHYTFSGPNDIAPTKIFDDGHTTYFKMNASQTPKFSVITAHGDSVDVPARRTTDGLLAVDTIAPRFSLNQAGRQVTVYNEARAEVN